MTEYPKLLHFLNYAANRLRVAGRVLRARRELQRRAGR